MTQHRCLKVCPGEVDRVRATRLERELRALGLGGARRVVVDLSEVPEPSPELVGALLRGHRHLGWHNGGLVVVARAATRERLAWMGLDEALECVEADEAC